MKKGKGKTKSEKVRTSLLFTFSLLLFTFAARAEFDSSRLGVCSWTWHSSMTNVLEQMAADGRYNGMQLALAPWLGIDNTGTYFGDQEGAEVWELIKQKIKVREINVMSTMINFPKEDYSTLSSITNTQGYMYGVAEDWPDADEQWAANLRYTAKAAELTKELGVQYLTTEAGFICIDPEVMFNRMKEACAVCQKEGVTLLIESGPQHSQFMTNLLTRLNNAGVDNVGVNFDPGDTELFDAEDPVESYRAMKPWIRQIHVKDCMRFGLGGRYAWNEDCVWGEGLVSRLDFGGCHTFLNTVKNDHELDDVNILYERMTTDPTLMAAREKEVKLAMDRIIDQMTEPEGTPGNPWSVGAERGTVLAYREGNKVVFSGHGTMRDFCETVPAPWGTSVTAAEFGPQVGTIGANAFKGCDLWSLTMRGNPPTIGEGNDFTRAQVSVRVDAFEKFREAEGWKNLNIHAVVPVPYDCVKGVKKLAPFLHEIWFREEYESPTDEAYTTVPDVIPGFSCTSVRNGRYYGRNMDYYLSDVSSFIVHIPAKYDPDPKKCRLASVGVASQNAVREDGVTNGLYTASYDTLPEIMYDGINECGVIINNNVVPRYDCGTLTGTNPEGEPLHVIYLIRYVLDHATNALHAVELIKSRDLVGMAGPEYLLHWMVADPQGDTYVVEIINSKVVARKMDINSNFNWNWDNENQCAVDDDYAAAHGRDRKDYPIPYSNNVDVATIGKYYTPHAEGIERFNIVHEHYDEGATFEGMFNLMRRVQYTKLGDPDNLPIWLSDFSGDSSVTNLYDLYRTNYAGLMAALAPAFAWSQEVFAHKEEFRKKNSGEWQTVHNTTYDFEQKAFRIAVQEDYEHTFDFFLVDRRGTKADPWLVGKEGLDSVKAYLDDGKLIVEGHGTMRDFCETAPAPWGAGIREAQFGPQVMGIGANAFRGCDISQLEMRGNPPALGAGNDFSSAEIGVRADALAKFVAADGWRALESRIRPRPFVYEWEKVRTLAPFLHEVWYNMNYGSPLDGGAYTNLPDVLPAFSCTAVRNGNYLGRNLDSFLDDIPAFIVHMPAKYAPEPAINRLASVGATQHPALHEDGVTDGQYTASYECIPEMMYDGINECGVVVEQNVAPRGDCGESEETKAEDRESSLFNIYVTRYVLDHATNAAHGVELIKSRNIVDVKGAAYLLHWMIADPQETYVVEIVTNAVVARKMDIMTNFNLNWDNVNKCAIDDDYVAANGGWARADYPKPYDTNNVSLAQIDKYYTPHSDGVERFCVMRDHYDDGRTFEGMFSLLRRVQYTKLGDPENRPMWLSDFSASYSSITDFYGLYRTNVVELMARLDPMFAWSQEVFAHKEHYRTQNTHEWQTVYNATYDIEKRMFRIAAQEDYAHTFDIYLVPRPEGSELNPWAVGPDGRKYDVAAWTNGTGGLVLEGAGPVATMPWRGDEEISELVKDKGVEGVQSIIGSLPGLEYVNGLTREEFTAAALGFVKADNFSTINVENGEAKLGVVVSRSDELGESADWKPVSTNEVTVPAPGEQGFFIVAPVAPSDY